MQKIAEKGHDADDASGKNVMRRGLPQGLAKAEAQKQGGQNETAAHKEERPAERQRIMNNGKCAAPEHGDGDKGQLLTAERQIGQAQHMKDSCMQGELP